MHTPPKARHLVLGILALAAAGPAWAQTWREYAYPELGFSAQFPVQPTVAEGQYKAGGLTAPAKLYTAHQGAADYSITVADLSASSIGKDAAIAGAARTFAALGAVKIDVIERIDREYGRELTVVGQDGSHTATAIFYVNQKLYVLAGRSDELSAPLAVRFQQSLQFVDAEGKPPRRPEDGPAPGGPGLGPPPPQAFADCRGKREGAAVRHTTPRGDVVAATCIQTPEGLAARPDG
jgi:hypothetical protein